MPWAMHSRMFFPRNHQRATDCTNLHPLLHLVGRTYLSTKSQLNLNTGPLALSPLIVYTFSYNVSFTGMPSGISVCPDRLEITLPLLQMEQVQYVPWRDQTDQTLFNSNWPSPRNVTKQFCKALTLHILNWTDV